jgi:DNA polymerase-1
MTDAPPTLLLVDGSSYLYRAFHAMPDLRVNPGDPASPATGAIRGMINMMNSLRKDVPALYAACVFDAKGPTFRDDIYPQYKANRSPMPDDLRTQIEPIHELVRLLGWKVLNVPGVEADDVIGTLAHMAASQGVRVIISSGDKDLSQLVNEQVTMVDTMNGKRRDVAGVEAEFGVKPELMLDYQTLVGDAVDNVPGVPKVGPKTAAKWLQEYGSLQNLLTHAHDIKGVVGENLRQSLSWLPTARQLLHIRTDCDLSAHVGGLPDLGQLLLAEPQSEALTQFYVQHGFKSLAAKSGEAPAEKKSNPGSTATPDLFDDPAPVADSVSEVVYETVLDETHLQRWVDRINAAALTCIDTETHALNSMQARLVGISLAVEPGCAAYIPVGHNAPGCPAQLDLQVVLAHLRPWLENPAAPKLGQHIKYDRHVLANHGIDVKGYVHDTMLQSYVLEVHKPHGLESLALRHLGLKGLSFEELCGKGAHQISFAQVELQQAARYSCEDADYTLRVHQLLWPRLQQLPELNGIYQLEIESSESLYRMERNGVLIDAQALAQQSHELGQRILQLEQQAHELAGQPFNLGSPKQIGEIFFEKLGMPVVKKTATGAPSTDEEVLEKLAENFPLPKVILEHRSLSKLKGTYTDKLAAMADPVTGRVHTHYAQAVAVTGRLSSNEPNLQNIPIRTAEGRRVREAFVASPGCLIASADYSQIELRIMAHISQDAALLRAFHEGMDVHRATAAEVFGLPPDQVSPDQRRYAKVINFGLIYGMSAFGLAKALDIDNTAARNYIDRYFQRFEGVKRYMDETRTQAKARGYVETVFGRRLYLPEINSPNGPRRAGAERAAINAPMQGTAADLIKMSMNQIQKTIDQQQRRTRMIMQVHDELVFEVPQDEVDWIRQSIPALMAGVAQLRVPLLAELGLGPNWEQAH